MFFQLILYFQLFTAAFASHSCLQGLIRAEFHGLRISVRGFEGKWVSTIGLTQTDSGAQRSRLDQQDPYTAADTELGRT